MMTKMPEGPAVTIGQHSSPGRKDRNDDSYGVLVPESPLLTTKGIAMAIADGVSSSDAAKEASESSVRSFLEDYYCTHESWTVKKSVGTVLTAINNWLYSQGQTLYLSDRGMVTTFSGLVLKSGIAHIFHAGDSRISRYQNGMLEPLTRDHRAHVSREDEYLSRAFGIDPDLDVDYRSETAASGDIFIFTTDGVHDFVRSSQMVEILQELQDDLDKAAKSLVDAAFENGSADNLTCQIVRVESAGLADERSYFRKLTTLPFPPHLEPGMNLDGYRIKRELHSSKRTQVYLATDMETGDEVAIKTPSVNYEDDPVYLEMFTREEWIGKRVKSPNVVRVIEPKARRQFLYYVTEFVEGQTLREWMNDHPQPDNTEVRSIVDQIASGLRAFHRKDMLHQDLKPENIVIDAYGTVKIIDFGSTGVAALDEADGPVDMPTLVGTVDYTAPEYHLGNGATKQSDIFSLGVIAYELLTGHLPYGKGFIDKRAVRKLEYMSAVQHNSAVPAWVDAALQKATHCDPAQRYDVLSAFMADLVRPNPELEPQPGLPMIEKNPLAFWKSLALLLLLANFVLILLLAS